MRPNDIIKITCNCILTSTHSSVHKSDFICHGTIAQIANRLARGHDDVDIEAESRHLEQVGQGLAPARFRESLPVQIVAAQAADRLADAADSVGGVAVRRRHLLAQMLRDH